MRPMLESHSQSPGTLIVSFPHVFCGFHAREQFRYHAALLREMSRHGPFNELPSFVLRQAIIGYIQRTCSPEIFDEVATKEWLLVMPELLCDQVVVPSERIRFVKCVFCDGETCEPLRLTLWHPIYCSWCGLPLPF